MSLYSLIAQPMICGRVMRVHCGSLITQAFIRSKIIGMSSSLKKNFHNLFATTFKYQLCFVLDHNHHITHISSHLDYTFIHLFNNEMNPCPSITQHRSYQLSFFCFFFVRSESSAFGGTLSRNRILCGVFAITCYVCTFWSDTSDFSKRGLSHTFVWGVSRVTTSFKRVRAANET